MVLGTMIHTTLLVGLIIVSIGSAYADVVHLSNIKPKETHSYSTAPSEQSYKSYGPPTPAPSAFHSSFASSTAASPYNTEAFSSNPVPSTASHDADAYSSNAAFSAIGHSISGSFPSSSQASTAVGSSTPVPQYYGSYGSSTPAPQQYDSYSSSTFAPVSASAGFSADFSSTPEQVIPNRPPSFAATSYGASFSSSAPSYNQGTTVTKSESYELAPEISVANVPAPHREVTINKEVPVPYYVQVEKKIPYPVYVRVPHPYPVTVEKHVPYAVRVNVDRPVNVPQPYPVQVEKRVPYPVEKPVPYEVRVPVDRPYPVHVPYEKPVPYAVEKPVPYPVRVNVDRPYPVEKPVPYPVTIEKKVPYPVDKPVPYPVEKLVPYPVENRVPYPVRYEVPVNVPVPVEVRVPVTVDRPVPYPVEKKVPYPVRVPYEVKVPVPVQAPAQRFATVHYYQQSPVVLSGYESYQNKAFASGSAPGQMGSYNTAAYSSNNIVGQQQGYAEAQQFAAPVRQVQSAGYNNGAFAQQAAFESSTTSAPSSSYSAGLATGDDNASSAFKPQHFGGATREVFSTGGSQSGGYGIRK